jgi:hypothetical protein
VDEIINVFIGYDTREIISYHVCVQSIIKNSTNPITITPLSLSNLKDYSELHPDGTTNAIESVNMRLRKITKNCGSFPSDEALSKLF